MAPFKGARSPKKERKSLEVSACLVSIATWSDNYCVAILTSLKPETTENPAPAQETSEAPAQQPAPEPVVEAAQPPKEEVPVAEPTDAAPVETSTDAPAEEKPAEKVC